MKILNSYVGSEQRNMTQADTFAASYAAVACAVLLFVQLTQLFIALIGAGHHSCSNDKTVCCHSHSARQIPS